MRILIANDGMNAHFFERMSWCNAFKIAGYECVVYNCKTMKAFDVFDRFKPDIFIGQLYNIDQATIKCLEERPNIKYALRAGEYRIEKIDDDLLETTDKDIKILNILIKKVGNPEFIYTHYLQEDIEQTHHLFKDKYGIKLLGIPMSGDVAVYSNAVFKDYLKCDVGFVGGYWPYKGKIIDSYLTPLLEKFSLNVKIFGNQLWPHINQYCGIIDDEDVKNLFVSASICPNLSEPHAHKYGIDLNERAFKILTSGGFCIMDNIDAAKKVFTEGVVFAENPKDFREKIFHYLKPENFEERLKISIAGQKLVLKSHTNFHRGASILEACSEHYHAKKVLDAYYNNFQQRSANTVGFSN